jgi:hypothetical protein
MTTELETVRPAVLDRATARQLDDYLRFRHLFRNLYGFDLDWERCSRLLDGMPETFGRLENELAAFIQFLKKMDGN